MISAETAVTFLGTSVLLALAPGPDNVFVLTQSALAGRKAGLLVTLGLCTGLLVHCAAVAWGVASLIQTSDTAFFVLQLAGAAWLLWLAWQAFRAAAPGLNDAAEGQPLTGGRLYARGIVMNVTNPKVSLFFLAFLPQFVDRQNGSPLSQLLQLGGLFMLTTLVVFGGIAWLAGSLRRWLVGSAAARLLLNRIAAVVFLGLAVSLLLSHR